MNTEKSTILEIEVPETFRIGHSGDALDLLDEMLENARTGGLDCRAWCLPRLEALKDAIERSIA